MLTRRKPSDQYLFRKGGRGTYYARVRVPPKLARVLKKDHLLQSLSTDSETEANILKHEVVARMKSELQKRSRLLELGDVAAAIAQPLGGGKLPADAHASVPDPTEWRKHLREAHDAGDFEAVEALEDAAQTVAERIADQTRLRRIREGKQAPVDVTEDGHQIQPDTEDAVAWFKSATTLEATLAELVDKWNTVADGVPTLKLGRARVVRELVLFLKDPHARPSAVTQRVATRFFDDFITKQGWAFTTMRDRLNDLGAFWGWMEGRGEAPRNSNPWRGLKVTRSLDTRTRAEKRPYTDEELLRLLTGSPKVWTRPTYPCVADLIVLGLYTGARIEELCARAVEDFRAVPEGYVFQISDAKTDAGNRWCAVVNPAPVEVVRRRLEAATAKGSDGRLFPELSRGGADKKFSAAASKAFGNYRRALAIPDGCDFHSFRRCVATVLVNDRELRPVDASWFLGHKTGNMTADLYAGGSTPESALAMASHVRYEPEIEKAARELSTKEHHARPRPRARRVTQGK